MSNYEQRMQDTYAAAFGEASQDAARASRGQDASGQVVVSDRIQFADALYPFWTGNLDAYRDILWAVKWLVVPGILISMSLVVAVVPLVSIMFGLPLTPKMLVPLLMFPVTKFASPAQYPEPL